MGDVGAEAVIVRACGAAGRGEGRAGSGAGHGPMGGPGNDGPESDAECVIGGVIDDGEDAGALAGCPGGGNGGPTAAGPERGCVLGEKGGVEKKARVGKGRDL